MPSPSLSRSPSPPEDLVATTMGFSSFGAKPNPPKKKRKLALDPHTTSEETSGSNNTPLGVRIRRSAGDAQQQEKRNQDFGMVEENEEQEEEEEEQGKAKHQSHAIGQGNVHGSLNRGRGRARPRHDVQRSGREPFREQDPASSNAPDDALAAAARDESAAMMLETGLLPQYLDWSGGVAGEESGGGVLDGDDGGVGGRFEQEGKGKGSGGGGRGEDGEWDWQALRMGVRDQRGDVAFYDKSFVEDPWRGFGAGERG
ncbi:hypothetical protein BDR22DRAFT_914402 [Usnea florida]